MNMRTIDLVRRHYDRLNNEFETGRNHAYIKRSKIFQEWVSGKILLDEKETQKARESAVKNDLSETARGVYDSFLEMNDRRLVPALTFTKDGKPIFILVLQP